MVRKKNNNLVNIKNGNRSTIFVRFKPKKSDISKLENYIANLEMIYKEDIIEAKPFEKKSLQNRERLKEKYAKYSKRCI